MSSPRILHAATVLGAAAVLTAPAPVFAATADGTGAEPAAPSVAQSTAPDVAPGAVALFEADVAIAEDSSVTVEENRTVDFGDRPVDRYTTVVAGSGEITDFGHRGFGLTDVRARAPEGLVARVGEADGETGDVEVVFSAEDGPGLTGEQELGVSYTYDRAVVEMADGVPVYLADLVGPERDAAVGRTRVDVRAPSVMSSNFHCFAGAPDDGGECDSVRDVPAKGAEEPSRFEVAHGPLEPGERLSLEVALSYRVEAEPPAEGEGEQREQAMAAASGDETGEGTGFPWVAVGAVLVVAAGVAIRFFETRRRRRRSGASTGAGHQVS